MMDVQTSVGTQDSAGLARVVDLTDSASRHIAAQMQQHPDASAFRIGIKSSGCSGYMYTVDIADQVEPEDEVIDFDKFRVAVSRKAVPVLRGTTVDFVRKGLNSMFQFHNPNAGASCGCGESFTTDTIAAE